MACNGSAIDFPCVGALEPNIAFGGQSLEIQREVWILYPRIVPICNIYIYNYMHTYMPTCFFYICICICIIMYLSYSNICLFIIDFFTTHCKLTLSLVTLNSVRSSWTGCPRGCDERSCDLPWRQRCFQHPIYHGRLWGYEEVKSPIFPLYDNHYQSFKSLF